MTHLSYRQFIAAVVTVAVAITGFSAVPARAGQDDLAKVLAALAGLAVLGVVVKNVTDDDKKKSKPKIEDRRYGYDGRYGRLRVFGQRCLDRHYRHVDDLPQKCVRRYPTNYGTRYGYGARCLSRKGYNLARH